MLKTGPPASAEELSSRGRGGASHGPQRGNTTTNSSNNNNNNIHQPLGNQRVVGGNSGGINSIISNNNPSSSNNNNSNSGNNNNNIIRPNNVPDHRTNRGPVSVPTLSVNPVITTKSSSANNRKPTTSSGGEEWNATVVEAIVRVEGESGSGITVLGGSDNGQFPYLGDISSSVNYEKGGPSLAPGAILLEIQGQKVAGYTQRDVVAWLQHCTRNGNPCVIRTAPPGKFFLSKNCSLV